MNPAIPAAAGPAGHEPAAAPRRTPPKRKARQLAKHLRDERPDYTRWTSWPSWTTACSAARS